jgi:hypothetical protein
MSVRQGEEVAALIEKLGLSWNLPWDGRPAVVEETRVRPIALRGGITMTLLSPRRPEMDRLANFWHKTVRGRGEQSQIETDESSQTEEDITRAEPLVYVASSHKDREWLDRVRQMLVPLLPDERIFSAGPEIAPNEVLAQRRRDAIGHARVGLVLVSSDALASHWVQEDISLLVAAAAESQLALTWILVRPAAVESTALFRYQAAGDPRRPLSELPAAERMQQLKKIANQIADLALNRGEASPRRRQESTEGPIDVESLAGQEFHNDRSIANNASIAFLAEHRAKSLLVCGDASAEVLAESIAALIRQRGVRRLRVDAMVVPHGGSARNLNRELLELLDCQRYLVATNGERYLHPSRETIARILAFGRTDRNVPLTLVFNYRVPTTVVWDDPELQQRWNYRALYPQGDGGGIKVQI